MLGIVVNFGILARLTLQKSTIVMTWNILIYC